MNLWDLSITELQILLQKHKISSVEIVTTFLQRISQLDSQIKAFLNVCEESALIEAKNSDQRRKQNQELSSLDGIPIAIKDNIITKGIQTTCASQILANFIPIYNSHVIEEIQKNGGIILGKTNMDEFAMGASCESSAFFSCHNPWNLKYSPGGSSGGSAACVSAKMCPIALGSDTGGSVRQPAALCGVLGLKPTYGRISRFGLVAFASSLDQIGILAQTSFDIAMLLQIIATPDSRDSTQSQLQPPNFLNKFGKIFPKKLKIGIPEQYWQENGIYEEVYRACQQSIEIWKNLGAEIIPISLPHTSYAIETYYIIAMAEASSNLSRYDGVRYGMRTINQTNFSQEINTNLKNIHNNLDELYSLTRGKGFGKEVKRRILLGTYSLSEGYYDSYYNKALQTRTIIREEISQALKELDMILTPTSPIPSFRLGEKINSPLSMYLCDIFTVPFSLSGHPAISIPIGLTKNGLPIGIQIVSKYWEEDSLLAYTNFFEQYSSYIGKSI